MKASFTIFLIVIASSFLCAQSDVKSNSSRLTPKPTKNFKAYLTVNPKGKALENIGMQQAAFEDRIKDAVSAEGIQIVKNEDIEKHGEHYLYIDVILKDSLNINTKSFSGGQGNSVIERLYPNKSYPYKDVSDITSSVKKYIKEYVLKLKVSRLNKGR